MVEVIQNPTDPMAWAELGADVLSLAVPGVTGGGAMVRAAATADDLHDAVTAVSKTEKIVNTFEYASKATASADLHRPYIRKWVREAVENSTPRLPDGRFLDANTKLPIDGKYDLGHVYSHEFWREKEYAMRRGMTQKQFNDYMNNPKFYQIEDPHTNRSRTFEKK